MSVRLADCRPLADYREGHLPDAVHFDRERDLTGEIGDARRGRHPLPTAEHFTAVASRAGIGPETFVLAYDAGEGWSQRLWWLLRHFGHEAAGTFDVRTYDGPLETDAPRVEQLAFVARERSDDTISAEEIHTRLGDPLLVLADARSPQRWRGEVEPLDPVAGRIPGARNAFFEQPLPDDLARRSGGRRLLRLRRHGVRPVATPDPRRPRRRPSVSGLVQRVVPPT